VSAASGGRAKFTQLSKTARGTWFQIPTFFHLGRCRGLHAKILVSGRRVCVQVSRQERFFPQLCMFYPEWAQDGRIMGAIWAHYRDFKAVCL